MNLDDMDVTNHTKNVCVCVCELRKDEQLFCTINGTCRDIFVKNPVEIHKET